MLCMAMTSTQLISVIFLLHFPPLIAKFVFFFSLSVSLKALIGDHTSHPLVARGGNFTTQWSMSGVTEDEGTTKHLPENEKQLEFVRVLVAATSDTTSAIGSSITIMAHSPCTLHSELKV